MKNIKPLLMVGILAFCLSACHESKQQTPPIKHKPKAEKPQGPKKMGDYHQARTVKWLDKDYTVDVTFQADTSLPVVNYDGVKYYDNRITLKILRPDGSSFFTKSYTKRDFQPYLDSHFGKKGALLGIVLDHAEGNQLLFAASVGSPDELSDEYIPLVIRISRTGDVSIGRDTQLDTANPEDAEAEDEDGV